MTLAHHSLFKWWPWVDLDLFYSKVKFGNLGFSIGKSENCLFFRTIAAWNQLKKWTYVSIEGQGHFLTLAQGHLHKKTINLLFSETTEPINSQKPLSQSKPNFICKLSDTREMKIYWHDAGHMTKMAAMPIYGKNPSKIFFSGTGGPISMKLGM